MTVQPAAGASRWRAFAIILAAGILIRLAFFLWLADKPLMSDAVNYNESQATSPWESWLFRRHRSTLHLSP